jgi:hypothetical protein
MSEAALLPKKFSSHLLILDFYPENFILCLRDLFSFHYISAPDPISKAKSSFSSSGSTPLLGRFFSFSGCWPVKCQKQLPDVRP